MWPALRADRPVAWVARGSEGEGFWALTKHADVVAALRDPRLSSERGNDLDTMTSGSDPALGRMLNVMEPPRHSALRSPLQKAFRRAAPAIAEQVRIAAHELVAGALERQTCDFAADVADHIPFVAVCELMGVPQSDRQQMLEITKAVVGRDAADLEATSAAAAAARTELLMYYAQLLGRRRRDPGEDLVSVLAEVEIEGERLGNMDVVLNCFIMVLAGNATTRLSASGGLLALIEHPDQWERLTRGDAPLDPAVDEVLRWTSSSTHVCRIATEDLRIEDHLIEAGELVTLWAVSANRDEDVFDEPYAFDISRTPNRHLALGYGRHNCLGASLARVALAALLQALREQVATVELAGTPRRLRNTTFAGVTELPVRLAAA